MKISATPSFLIVSRRPKSRLFEIALHTSFSDVLGEWGASTRVSPVFPLSEPFEPCDSTRFKGKWYIAFVGPCSPAKLFAVFPDDSQIWLSLGLLNVIVANRSGKKINKFKAHVRSQGGQVEIWQVEDGAVRKMRSELEENESKIDSSSVASLLKIEHPPELKAALMEYCPMMAATTARSRCLPAHLQEGLQQAHSIFAKDLLTEEALAGDNAYLVLAEVLAFHSGLSRFIAQGLVGISPLAHTESHYWGHSLLGLGSANIALWNICHFLQKKLGDVRIPERLLSLAATPNEIDYVNISSSLTPPDHLFINAKLEVAQKAIAPQIPFFSSRDGYQSRATTISAPISAVTGCNSMRWSLLTVTHEYIHPIVQEILSDIIPDLDDASQLEACCKILQGVGTVVLNNDQRRTVLHAATVHAEAKRLVFMTMLMIANLDKNPATGIHISQVGPVHISQLCQTYRHDIEETLVHLLDFSYIYQRKVEHYVPAIWTSWGTVPNVATRVKDYIIRTIIAVASKHLRRGTKVAISTAREEVLNALLSLQASGRGGRYVAKAIEGIQSEQEWETIIEAVMARIPLMTLTAHILFSENLSGELHRESHLSPGNNDYGGYQERHLNLTPDKIDNPLLFISSFTAHEPASAGRSAWLLYILAYGVSST